MMRWTYPRLSSKSPWHLGLMLVAEIVLVIALTVITTHCIWRLEKWRLLNGNYLEWDLGLHRNWGRAQCDGFADPKFQAVCMSIFQSTFGTIGEIRDFICGLGTADVKIAPEYLKEARIFQSSCSDMQSIHSISLSALSLMILASLLVACCFVLMLAFCYKKFSPDYKVLYWVCLGLQPASCLLVAITISLYALKMPAVLPGLFHYVDSANPQQPPIQKVIKGGSLTTGFDLAVIVLLIDALATACLVFWLPVAHRDDRLRAGRNDAMTDHLIHEDAGKDSESSFAAYIPEVFRSDFPIKD